jgi:hypothetical protein
MNQLLLDCSSKYSAILYLAREHGVLLQFSTELRMSLLHMKLNVSKDVLL